MLCMANGHLDVVPNAAYEAEERVERWATQLRIPRSMICGEGSDVVSGINAANPADDKESICVDETDMLSIRLPP